MNNSSKKEYLYFIENCTKEKCNNCRFKHKLVPYNNYIDEIFCKVYKMNKIYNDNRLNVCKKNQLPESELLNILGCIPTNNYILKIPIMTLDQEYCSSNCSYCVSSLVGYTGKLKCVLFNKFTNFIRVEECKFHSNIENFLK